MKNMLFTVESIYATENVVYLGRERFSGSPCPFKTVFDHDFTSWLIVVTIILIII